MFEGWSSHDRPQSAEKIRWLARANLLKEGDSKVASIAEADQIASRNAFDAHDQYFYLEYIDWFGAEVLSPSADHGELCCPGCKHAVGSFVWSPSMRLLRDGKLEAPLFRVHKNNVHHVSVE